MNSKLLIFLACVAFAAAASVPNPLPVGDLREAFETEDAIYIPISAEEAQHLRLPRSLETADTLVHFDPIVEIDNNEENDRVRRNVDVGVGRGPYLAQVRRDSDEMFHVAHKPGGFHPSRKQEAGYGNPHRVRRDVAEVVETEDAFYVPVSDQEVESLRLPRHVHNGYELPSEIFYVPDEHDE